MAQKTYITTTNQDVFDVCVIIYGSLDHLAKLMQDNNLTVDDYIDTGTTIYYDASYVPNKVRFSTGTPNAYYPVDALPIITSQPAGSNVCNTSGDADFYVIATGPGPLTYQWQYSSDGSATWHDLPGMFMGGTIFSGWSTDHLHMAAPLGISFDYYQFRCVISNSLGSTYSDPAILRILDLVTVTSIIPGFTVAYETYDYPVTASVASTGPGYSLQWQYSNNGTTWFNCVNGTVPGFPGSMFVGANTTNLTITNVQAAMNATVNVLRMVATGCNTSTLAGATFNYYTFETETKAFKTAGIALGETMPIGQELALDRFVKDLKGISNTYPTYNVISKFIAIYPMIGFGSPIHSLNLISPGTIMGAPDYYLNYPGGVVGHSYFGIQFGIGAYARTGIIPNTSLPASSKHYSFYSRTASTGIPDEGLIGSYDTPSGAIDGIRIDTTGPIKSYGYASDSSVHSTASGSLPDTKGLFVINRISPSTTIAQVRSTQTVNTNTPVGNPSQIVTIGRLTTLGIRDCNLECAFASIGQFLSGAESLAFYDAVQAYQTALGRQV